MPTFWQAKGILQRVELRYVNRYDVCPNDCIVYYDSKNLPSRYRYRHAHRVRCPVCDTPRYVTDPTDGASRAVGTTRSVCTSTRARAKTHSNAHTNTHTRSRVQAKVLFFFPVKYYIRSLFSRPELVPFLYSDQPYPEGHTCRSRGFQQKVCENPHMNSDHRNLGLVGTTDGVPFFADQKRGAWPFVLRCANLPDTLSTHMSNCHLHLLSANEFWQLDREAGVLRRRVRAPKSLVPHMTLVVDDLLGAYRKGLPHFLLSHRRACVPVFCDCAGVEVVDASIPLGRPHRRFRCKCCLLFWTGDYPAQAAVSGTHSKTCHWCTMKSAPAPEVTRRVWGDYRRYLPASHELREASGIYGPAEARPPPDARTHAGFVADAEANAAHAGALRCADARQRGIYKKDLPYKSSGVQEVSPLRHYPFFDLVWDVCPDMMHIQTGIFKRHIGAMLAGDRTPAPAKARKKNTKAENAELSRAHAECLDELKSWTLSKV